MKQLVTSCSGEIRARIEQTMDSIAPRVLPAGWSESDRYANAGWWIQRAGLRVCLEIESHGDAGLWIHVSVSRSERVPSYDDLKLVKSLFIGEERKAIQVFPPKSEHYNHHEFCLHLWSPLDGDPLPDFRAPGGGL